MGKYQNKKQKKKSNTGLIAIIVILAVITLAAFVLFIMPQLLYDESSGDDIAETAATEAITPATEATAEVTEATQEETFPLTLADSGLVIESLFQFDGINPDAGNQEGTNIASIVLKNNSGKYLDKATVTLYLADGTALNFAVTDLPAGRGAMAFSAENQSIPADAKCADWKYEVTFDETAVTESDQVDVSVDGVTVTLTNVSDEDISEIVVYCRCPFDGDYFGGITYQYTINDLPAGETATVEALDCILGMAEVVRIAIN